MTLDAAYIERYLSEQLGQGVQLVEIRVLNKTADLVDQRRSELKIYGYGQPLLIRYRLGMAERCAVLRTLAANPFGHEHRADRAAGLLLSYDIFNDLPRHVRALDVGVQLSDGQLLSLREGREFFLLTDYAEGTLYAEDLGRLRDTGQLTNRDLRRAESLANYLAEIHSVKRDDPGLYRRAIRDLVGSGEGIFGLTDSYPADCTLVDAGWFQRVEQACVRWRWRLNAHPERLAQIHGDFHPFNLLFEHNDAFWLLDRSRGGWGEPADDVACMAINYLFFSLQRSGEMAAPFTELWSLFWSTYLGHTGDQDLLECVAPFFIWRALVVASPIWYNVPDAVRGALFNFIDNLAAMPVFDPAHINDYLRPTPA